MRRFSGRTAATALGALLMGSGGLLATVSPGEHRCTDLVGPEEKVWWQDAG